MDTISRFSKLQSGGFVLGLLLLLLNDFVLKTTFHNWFTGKLSDLTGLFIFPIFLSVFFPRHCLKIYWATALGFIFWKSSWSSNFIETWNRVPYLFPIDRVVDYSDYLALVILPFSYQYFKQGTNFRVRLAPWLLVMVAGFAFMATSRPTPSKTYTYNVRYKIFMPREEVVEKLKQIDTLSSSSIVDISAHSEGRLLDTLSFAFSSPKVLAGYFKVYASKRQACLLLKRVKVSLSRDEKKSSKQTKEGLRKQFEAIIINQLGKPVIRF